jgi:hypothetical protein
MANNTYQVPKEVESLYKYYLKIGISDFRAYSDAVDEFNAFKAGRPVSDSALQVFNNVRTAGGQCTEVIYDEKVEQYAQKAKVQKIVDNGLCTEITFVK